MTGERIQEVTNNSYFGVIKWKIDGMKGGKVDLRMKKQLVLWHNEKMWDKEASEYILMEPFFDRVDKPKWVEEKKIVIADDVFDYDTYEKDCKYIL